jgi:hypothetical protein
MILEHLRRCPVLLPHQKLLSAMLTHWDGMVSMTLPISPLARTQQQRKNPQCLSPGLADGQYGEDLKILAQHVSYNKERVRSILKLTQQWLEGPQSSNDDEMNHRKSKTERSL